MRSRCRAQLCRLDNRFGKTPTAHNAGTGAKSTRGRQWRLVHSEVFNTRGEAMAREYELKKDRKTRRALMLGAGLDGMPD